ncbi:MAG: beta-ketoacyl-[acyl-carrier-protein] synthase family protein [Bacteroidetes bacterium]|nr:beta-ketoacyl-[acyl-carrier-protein] synthase family protein [Bacteroidota bacterium]
MENACCIVGLGAISSIGLDVEENYESLQSLQSGISYPEFLQTLHKTDLPVCEIKKSDAELAALCKMPLGLPRTVYLSAIAVQQTLAVIANHDMSKLRIGFISGNTIGGMDRSEYFFTDYLQNQSQGQLQDIRYHECGSITELVAKHFGIKHFVTTINTACSSSANAMIHASRLLKNNKLDIVIAGGADALCRFTLNGFNTLMILDSEPSKPFDENRKGLNLGEGAAYLMLTSEAIRSEYNLHKYATLSGYANANDAFHQTASSAEGNGNYQAMKEALAMTGLTTSDIHYINAHGTGTGNNDASEGIAIQRLFGENIPPVSSTKANTGHTLGACGALEAVYACLGLRDQVIFPNLRFETQMKDLHFSPDTKWQATKNMQHIMSNSFGFGGNCTSLIFSKDS